MKSGVLIKEAIYHVDEDNKVIVCTLICDLQTHKIIKSKHLT